MRFVIVTGMSGAGKSSVLKMLEDFGYFCVDNLPIQLAEKFASLTTYGKDGINKVALGLDIRSGHYLKDLDAVLLKLRRQGFQYEILFMDCSSKILLERYKTTGRAHPLVEEVTEIESGIQEERTRLDFLKKEADMIIDTSQLPINDLESQVKNIYFYDEKAEKFTIKIQSFGYKYEIPKDSDLVFDVSFLPDPSRLEELKEKNGEDKAVGDYVLSASKSKDFIKKISDIMKFLIPNYILEGKEEITIAIGCEDGVKKSVALAKELSERMDKKKYGLKIEHRDINKGG